MSKELTKCQMRCQDCACLQIKNGVWVCDECFGQEIENIDECPEGIALEEIKAIDEKAKANPIKNVARAAGAEKKERKPRERKPDAEKENLIAETAKFLETIAENVTITNISKIIEFDLGDSHYKIDLIRQRKAKNK